ncbi:hypothetical protein ABR36_01600 [Enterobacter ludwigii]|nr:hypothetical protein ABR36_01600 [Enterobacter ludwigii]
MGLVQSQAEWLHLKVLRLELLLVQLFQSLAQSQEELLVSLLVLAVVQRSVPLLVNLLMGPCLMDISALSVIVHSMDN